MIYVTQSIELADSELHFDYIHSSGPGGQNVNKVATAVQLRFNILHSPSFDKCVKDRLLQQCRNRINSEGTLVIDARKYRTQMRNRQEAIDRLIALIQKATKIPKKRKKTGISKSQREKRFQNKLTRKKIKEMRKTVDPSSDAH